MIQVPKWKSIHGTSIQVQIHPNTHILGITPCASEINIHGIQAKKDFFWREFANNANRSRELFTCSENDFQITRNHWEEKLITNKFAAEISQNLVAR